MAFKTFAPGVLTSSDVNTFLMRQAVITCTSSTRPASPSEGMTIYETDTNVYAKYDGSAWVREGSYESYSPTTTEWTVGNATIDASYAQVGNVVHYRGRITWGSTSALLANPNGQLRVSFPIAPSGSVSNTSNFGGHMAVDASTGITYLGQAQSNLISGTWWLSMAHYYANGFKVQSGKWDTTFAPFSPVAGDSFLWSITYEGAA